MEKVVEVVMRTYNWVWKVSLSKLYLNWTISQVMLSLVKRRKRHEEKKLHVQSPWSHKEGPQIQQPCEPGEKDQLGDRFKSVYSEMGSLKISTFYFIHNENPYKAARTDFFNPFFSIFIQFKLQTAVLHSASGHLTWSTPETLPITAECLLIPPATGISWETGLVTKGPGRDMVQLQHTLYPPTPPCNPSAGSTDIILLLP